jgi:hypothetical protein
MRKLLSLVALSCAVMVAAGVFATRANATPLPSGVMTLKVEQSDAVQKAYYGGYRHHRHWRHYGWRHGYGRHYGWRHHYGYGYGHYGWRHHHYYHRRHYYYQSYDRPYYRGYGYGLYRNCIGLCWW